MSYWFRQRLMKQQPRDERGRYATSDGGTIDRDPDLSSEDANIEARLAERVGFHYADTVKDYNALKDAKGGKVLNTDVARELSADYLADRTKAAAVHEPASHFIKKLYADKLKEDPNPGEMKSVVFTAGGTGAGKTTAIDTIPALKALSDKAQIVYDTNMNTFATAKQKVDQALAAHKDVHIVAVQRDPVDALVHGALSRAMNQERKYGSGRTVPLGDHAKTHLGVQPTMVKLAEAFKHDPRVTIQVINNDLGRGNAKLIPLGEMKHYDAGEVKAGLLAALEQEHDAKRISDKVYHGFKHG